MPPPIRDVRQREGSPHRVPDPETQDPSLARGEEAREPLIELRDGFGEQVRRGGCQSAYESRLESTPYRLGAGETGLDVAAIRAVPPE